MNPTIRYPGRERIAMFALIRAIAAGEAPMRSYAIAHHARKSRQLRQEYSGAAA